MFLYGLPINRNDGVSVLELNATQKKSLEEFLLKVSSGELNYIENRCLCGNQDKKFDVLITEKDRYGIPCRNFLCKKCGLIRQGEILDEESTYKFYSNYYRSIYVGSSVPSNIFFEDQVKRGYVFIEFIQNKISLNTINKVFEVGTGAGGILWPFFELGKQVSGCDYGESYLQFGMDKDMELYIGELDKEKTEPNSQDLLIISHVMEHFNDPVKELNNLIDVVKEGGYLLIEVPGSLSVGSTYANPAFYFQNAHVNNFNGGFLNLFFGYLGLEIVAGNEKCTFILKKPVGWKVNSKPFRVGANASLNAEKVQSYLKLHNMLYSLKISPYLYKDKIISVLTFLKLKNFFKRFLA